MQMLQGLAKRPTRLAFSPDGRYLVAGAEQHGLHLWDLTGSDRPLWIRGAGLWSRSFAFAPDSGSVVCVASQFLRYDVRTGEESADTLANGIDSGERLLSPIGDRVVGIIPNHTTQVLRGLLHFRLQTLQCDNSSWAVVWDKSIDYDPSMTWHGYRQLIISTDGRWLLRLYGREAAVRNISPSVITVFNAATGDALASWSGELPYSARQGVLSSGGVLVLLKDRTFYATDTNNPDSKPVKRLNSSPKHFTDVAFSPDGKRLATTSNDMTVTIWDTATWDIVRAYQWELGRLRAVAFAPDGLRCAAASDTGRIVVWDVEE